MKRRIIPKRPKIKDLIDNYLNVYAPHIGMKGIPTALSNCKVIDFHFGNKRFDDIKVRDIVLYLNERRKDAGDNSISFNGDGDYSKDYWIADRLLSNISKFRPKAKKRKERPHADHVEELLKIVDQPMHDLIRGAYAVRHRR